MQNKLNYLLDRSQPFTHQQVKVLDDLTLLMNSGSPEAKQAHQIWRLLKEDDYFWYRSHQILQLSQVNQTKVFILIILQSAIKQKWYALPEPQRQSLKSYIVNIVLQFGAIQNLPRPRQNILSKANSILVQIVKYQWNTTWNSFISDLCGASLNDMNICQNNFSILKMLSEEIFDYSKNQMTRKQITELKGHMSKDFETIFKLCQIVLDNANQAKPSLIKACLQTLHAFLSWIPLFYIICTPLIDKLLQLVMAQSLRNSALSCLVEIAGLQINSTDINQTNKFCFMLKQCTVQINKILPLTTDSFEISKIQNQARRRWNAFEYLCRSIALFYSQFFKQQQWLDFAIETDPTLIQVCRAGFRYLLMMMKIDDQQVFKICIEFFHMYIGKYLEKKSKGENFQSMSYTSKNQLTTIYKQIFLEVMKIMTLKMAKPEQVLIVIDEDGTPVRQQIQNTQNSSLYEIMRELATYLVRFQWQQMKKHISQEITAQRNDQNFSYDKLNSLSWIVGSLCGSMLQREQKSFFISTLRDLLHLCENKKGKQPKAVIASCIMYVVGQYPTFLRNSWSFLRTVTKKLFQFMKQLYPGIQQMACNTFIKIVKTTADQFTIPQDGCQPHIRQIIKKIPQFTERLTNDTLRFAFYQGIGYLIGAEKNPSLQLQYMKEAEGYFLYEYQNIIDGAQSNSQILLQDEVKRKILFFFKINQHIATGVGQQYILILGQIFDSMNKLYMFYSAQVSNQVQKQGKNVLNYMTIKSMRSIKKQILKIYIKYLQKCENLDQPKSQYILQNFIFPLGTLLQDFSNSIPETKQQEFVALFTQVLEKLNLALNADFLSNLINLIFQSSLPLITTDFNSFPQIRANFFSFLKALIKYNFNVLYSIDTNHFNTILDCVVWSLRHQLNTYCDLGLDLLLDILKNVNTNPQIMNAFYPSYHIRILTDILDVMTDGFHKSGLQLQTSIFYILIKVVSSNQITSPLAKDQSADQSNQQYLYRYLIDKLTIAFPHTRQDITVQKVNNWFNFNQEQFKSQVADYLVIINRYTQQQITQSQKPDNPIIQQ